jgi:RNA polymerase sigma-54 factor
VPRFRLNDAYAAAIKRDPATPGSSLADSLRQANWAVQTVRRRFDTILDVARAIVRRQTAYFTHGAIALKPLSLKTIAEELGMHESTVSRATNNKFMRTPHGIVELTYFFSRAQLTSRGTTFCGTAVRELVAAMIRDEPPDAPVSDAELARRLAQQGLVMSRRVVTKYRQQLGMERAGSRGRTRLA